VPRSPALREIQALFWRGLNGSLDPALEAAVLSTPGLAAADRLAIYRGMYVGRLHDVLAEDFEHTAAVVGPETFAATVRGYLAAHPSEHPSVRHLGRRFAAFLAEAPPPGSPPWLPDLARLEWARVEVFDAPDARPVDLVQLREVPEREWAGLVLLAIPALEVVDSAWPVHLAWRDGGDLTPEPTRLRIWRRNNRVYHAAMDRVERDALARLLAEQSFGEICEVLGDLEPEAAAAEAGALLARWLEDGLIAGVRSTGPLTNFPAAT
jgi:hypothetical protein